MGGMEITVPEDAEVEVGAFGVMGGVDHGGKGRVPRGAADPHHRRRGDGRHRGQAGPGPAIIPGRTAIAGLIVPAVRENG